MTKAKYIFTIIFAASILLNAVLLVKFFREPESKNEETAAAPSYRLISPPSRIIIDSNVQDSRQIIHYADLKPRIEAEIQKYGAENNIGFFLQDINTGAWMGINEREGFNPASLLKIPIMLAVLKKVELSEMTINNPLEIIEEDLDENAGELYQKGAGYQMPVWNFIEEMMLSSDNTAKNVLKRQLSGAELNSVFAHVGIPNPYAPSGDSLVTPRGYTRLFKSLYLSTYLPPDLSEKALEITTDTEMENLLSAGIPYEIQAAHKYGERPDGISDCGVIYHPQNPYYLCVMTKDLEIPKAKELIINLSKMVYQFVDDGEK